MANRKRNIKVRFRVSEDELALLKEKMQLAGTGNMEAYLRKMALDGYIVKLDVPELRALVSLLRRSGNNLNQLARRVHETGRFYDADLEELRMDYDRLWDGMGKILSVLSVLE